MTLTKLAQTSPTGERKATHCRRPHAQVHLPPLHPDDALLLVNVLEKAIAAIWRAHGEAMGDCLQTTFDGSVSRPHDSVWCGNPNGSKRELCDDEHEMPF